MAARLRILCLEDDPADAELMMAALRKAGLDVELVRVESAETFRTALGTATWDVILADYSLPTFDGLAALVIAKITSPDLPFILVSGTLGEEPAIEALTKGATDYVLKHNLARLAPAVRRALSESGERQERRRAEESARVLFEENRRLARELLDIQEEERRHIARELHDEIGQCLTAIQAETEIIRRRVGSGNNDILASADAILSISSGIYDTVHAILQRLRPAALDNLGLVDALRDTINTWQERERDTDVNFHYRGQLSELGEKVNITLYRTVQECLTNIASHANALHVEIALTGPDVMEIDAGAERACVTLIVHDDGCGLAKQSGRLGFGLIGMRERVEALSGRFDLEGPQGGGVQVCVSLPLGHPPGQQ